ncbi:hypothetical protein LTR64_002726 [Lithohypha guttulata]|uniref:uncharacterized protein n=1 Tax=Lithohypha guttulata TaxID=1690604 RepID=UPI00315D347D
MDSLIACGNKVLGAAVPREAPETQQHWPLFEGVSVAVGYVESKASKVAGQADKRDKDLQRKSHADVKRQLKWLLAQYTSTMATATPPPHAQPEGPKVKVYDPVRVVEGMFSGCLTRMAYVLRDPKNFGEPSPYIFAELQKRFADGCDDIEIKLLDLKWYLEQKLAENATRRQAEAIQKGTTTPTASATKRKHEEIDDTQKQEQSETPTKRPKRDDGTSPKSAVVATEDPPTSNSNENPPADSASQPRTVPDVDAPAQVQPAPSQVQPAPSQVQPAPSYLEKANDQPSSGQAKQIPVPATAPSAVPPEPEFNADYTAKSTPQETPIEPGDFFIESMFGDPTEDGNTVNSEDLNSFTQNNFDQSTAAAGTAVSNTINQDQDYTQSQANSSSLTSFLPGLEQYANQPDDPMNTQAQTLPVNTQSQDLFADFTAAPERNVWDDFLDDETNNAGNSTDFADIDVGNPEATNMNFDSLFDDDMGDFKEFSGAK